MVRMRNGKLKKIIAFKNKAKQIPLTDFFFNAKKKKLVKNSEHNNGNIYIDFDDLKIYLYNK